ncbi:hypothetical protein ACS0TY_018793 [Phlomoides rotata]
MVWRTASPSSLHPSTMPSQVAPLEPTSEYSLPQGLHPPSLQSNSTTISMGGTQVIVTLESTSNLERLKTLRGLIVPQGNW